MPAWFDLKSLDPSGPEDEKGIEKSKAVVDKLIEDEIKNGRKTNMMSEYRKDYMENLQEQSQRP